MHCLKKNNNTELNKLPLSNVLIIPIFQYSNHKNIIIVSIGDYVLKGQPLTAINSKIFTVAHASTSGFVIDISYKIVSYSSNLQEIYIHIKPDFKDQQYVYKPLNHYSNYSSEFLISYIKKFGINFLNSFQYKFCNINNNDIDKVNIFIINAVTDLLLTIENDCLLYQWLNEIINGIMIITYILKPKEIWFVIDKSKNNAITILRKIILEKNVLIKLKVIPQLSVNIKFSELIKYIMYNNKIPKNASLASIGVYIENIAIILAINKAIVNSEPFIERIITISYSSKIKKSIFCLVRIGTIIDSLFQNIKILIEDTKIVVINHLSEHLKLINFFIPINKFINNFIIFNKKNDITKKNQQPCIRCGLCYSICPVNLLPYKMYLFSKNKDYDKIEEFNILNCIECGLCSYICPSNIPLAESFKHDKMIVEKLIQKKQFSINSKKCFDNKIDRINIKNILRQQKYDNNSTKSSFDNKIKNISNKNKINSDKLFFLSKNNDKTSNIINKYKIEVDAAVKRVMERHKLQNKWNKNKKS